MSFAPEQQRAIVKEVRRLTDAGFIHEVDYLECLANTVLVKKANGT